MPIHVESIDKFLELAGYHPVLDVRSPGEYRHAHIPKATSLPLFDDAERAAIGTAYKQQSREAAIRIGLDAFGPRMRAMVEQVEAILHAAQREHHSEGRRTALVHCWRGGMRSEAVAWLLSLYGFEVHLLAGGYKAYRQWVIAHWHRARNFRILAGNTGSGKTRILHALKKSGAAVLDLEDLAKHKGSAFGGLDKIPQPSQEMFENLLGAALQQADKEFSSALLWVEDESQRIGDLNLPHLFYKTLQAAPRVFIDVPFERRLDNIVDEYGRYPIEQLINAMVRIKKRLGPLETKTAISFIVEGDIRECFRVLLLYYDKHYYPGGIAGNMQLDSSEKTEEEIAALIKDIS